MNVPTRDQLPDEHAMSDQDDAIVLELLFSLVRRAAADAYRHELGARGAKKEFLTKVRAIAASAQLLEAKP